MSYVVAVCNAVIYDVSSLTCGSLDFEILKFFDRLDRLETNNRRRINALHTHTPTSLKNDADWQVKIGKRSLEQKRSLSENVSIENPQGAAAQYGAVHT